MSASASATGVMFSMTFHHKMAPLVAFHALLQFKFELFQERPGVAHVYVEFVGPQQPNGEMAQWGNMAQRGKCGSTQENNQTGV